MKDQIEKVLDKYYDDVIYAAGSDKSDEQVELAVLQLQREAIDAILQLFLSSLPEEKEKHDTIKGVYDGEDSPDELVDCSATEASCYNQALRDVQEAIKDEVTK